jgi:hypothetical protein
MAAKLFANSRTALNRGQVFALKLLNLHLRIYLGVRLLYESCVHNLIVVA